MITACRCTLKLHWITRLLRLSALLCTGFLLSACSENVWNSPYSASTEQGKTLYSSFSARPKHLDPAKSYSANEYVFIAQIYEPPYQYHYLKRPYELIPATAEDMPEVRYFDAEDRELSDTDSLSNAAYSVYTINIKPHSAYQPHPAFAQSPSGEYYYHDLNADKLAGIHTQADFKHTGSRELKAQDYVLQIKRLADPKLHSPVAGIFANYIEGFTEYAEQLKTLRKVGEATDLTQLPMTGLSVEGDYSYSIRIKGVYPQFIYWMSMPFFAPMPWEALAFYEQEGMDDRNINLDWYPIGTGPFMLAENNPNLRMVLERNPNFREEHYPLQGMPEDQESGLLSDAGKKLPFLDRAVYSLEKETIPYWNKFLQGYYDNSGVSSDSFDQAVQMSGGELSLTPQMQEQGIQLSTAVNSSMFYMGFNMRDPILGGLSPQAKKLRQAISIAVDYEEYISIFLNGRGSAAQGPIAPGIFGYREGQAGINPVVYQWQDGQARRRYLTEAKQLLTEAGYANGIDKVTGKPLILHLDTVGSGPDSKANLQWMIKQYDKLGIQLVIRNTDYNRFQDKMKKGTAQIFQWGWNADYPDPENFMFLLYGPNNKVDAQGENAANYQNSDFDRLFETMKSMPNNAQRLAILDKMNAIVREDAPWVFGFNPKSFSLYHRWYSNAKPNIMANNTLKYKNIDAAQRTQLRKAWNQTVLWPVMVLLVLLLLSIIPAYLSYRRREQESAL